MLAQVRQVLCRKRSPCWAVSSGQGQEHSAALLWDGALVPGAEGTPLTNSQPHLSVLVVGERGGWRACSLEGAPLGCRCSTPGSHTLVGGLCTGCAHLHAPWDHTRPRHHDAPVPLQLPANRHPGSTRAGPMTPSLSATSCQRVHLSYPNVLPTPASGPQSGCETEAVSSGAVPAPYSTRHAHTHTPHAPSTRLP